jgi:TolB-like protein/Tfp pilus assembly protein PilF
MSLLAELQRRKVFKVGAAYLVIGWLLIQIATTVAPQLNIPDWAPRLITLVVLLGFPLALLLAWIIEATPEGVRIDRGTVGNKRVIATCAILAAAAIGWYWKTRPVTSSADVDLRSVAVLPFVNMSDDKGNEYFSDGISEEILNVLARVPELHVAARTSSFSFKGEKKEVPEIARELKVRMVLEGSVRKQADRVRITAQLIDAGNGFHLWSDTYDRRLEDIFAIQDEIAHAIAEQLRVKLAPAGSGTAPNGTTDLQAYELYLKGISLWQARGGDNLRAAEETFRAALKRDPKFAKAWAGVALAHSILPDWVGESPSTAYPPALDAAEHALALDPNLPEPYVVLGYMAAMELRFPTANAMFERASALAPSHATAHHWHSNSFTYQGNFDAALAEIRQAVSFDPKSAVIRSDYVSLLLSMNRPDEAVAVCEGILRDVPNYFACSLLHFDIALINKDVAAARAALEPLAALRGPEAIRLAQAQLDALDGKGDVQAVAMQVADLPDTVNDATGLSPLNVYDNLLWMLAIGRDDLAAQRFVRSAAFEPGYIRYIAYDPHFDRLHCDDRVQELLRSMNVDETHVAASCPKGL